MYTFTEILYVGGSFAVLFLLFICLLAQLYFFIDEYKKEKKTCKSCDYYDYGNNRCTFDYNENDLPFLPCSEERKK